MTFADGTALVRQAYAHGFDLPEKQSNAAWVEANVVLPAQVTSEPGPVDLNRTPYLREPLEAFNDPIIELITFMTSTQVAKTTYEALCLSSSIDRDPGKAMFVFPREKDAKEFAWDTIKPIIDESPALRRWLPDDSYGMTRTEFAMKRGAIYFGWPSPAELSRRSIRYLFMDEVDKWKTTSNKEGSPYKLAIHRTRVHWNRKIVEASTPTVPEGHIAVSYNKSDKRTYHVRCPECGEYEAMYWANIQYGEERNPQRIKMDMLAWYECPRCHAHLRDAHKPEMLNTGVWCPEGCSVGPDGKIIGDIPETTHRGYFLNCLYSPWLTYSEIAAAWLESLGPLGDRQDFINSWLAEVWEEKVESTEIESLESNIDIYVPTKMCPPGIQLIVAGADVQEHHIYYIIRGWGYGWESWLLEADTVGDFDRLGEKVLDSEWVVGSTGEVLRADMLCVDGRYRNDDVVKFARKQRGRARSVFGVDAAIPAHYRPKKAELDPRTGMPKKKGLQEWSIETPFYKKRVYGLAKKDGWHLYDGVSDEYQRQFISEHQIIETKGSGKRTPVWVTRPGYQANHYLDCEVYGACAADMREFWRLPDPQALRVPQSKPKRRGMRKPDGRTFVSTKRR